MYCTKVKTADQARAISSMVLSIMATSGQFDVSELQSYNQKRNYVDRILSKTLIDGNDLIVDVVYVIECEYDKHPTEHVMLFYEDDDPYGFDVTGDSIHALLRDVFVRGLEKGLI